MNKKYCCKIQRLADTYELYGTEQTPDIDEYLVNRWLGRHDYPITSVRRLADWFNFRIMRDIYANHGRNTLESYIEIDYQTITQEDEFNSLSLKEDLEADGIDLESLRNDLISASTMYRHLSNCLGIEKERNSSKESNWEHNKFSHAKNYFMEQVQSVLASYDSKGEIPRASEASFEVRVLLDCPECSTSVTLARALSQGYICQNHLAPED